MKRLILALMLVASWTVPVQAETAGEPVLLSNFAIPESLGKVEERFEGDTRHWVINIQDVHAHFTAQENIAAILEHLNAVYGIKAVASEGSWTTTSYPETWAIPSSREKQMVARHLMEHEHISGPAFAAMFSRTPLTLIGVEDPALYEENRQFYLAYYKAKAKTDKKIAATEAKLDALKKETYSTELLKFDHALANFREGKDVEKFIPELIKWAESKNIDLTDLVQTQLFKQAYEIENTLDKNKLKAEAERLMESFKRSRLSFEELLRSGKFSEEKLQYYPATQMYRTLMKIQDQIYHDKFFDEIDTAIDRLKQSLMTTEAEKALDARSERFFLAKKTLLFRAVPDGLRKLQAQKELIRSEMAAENLEDELKLSLNFYLRVIQRDQTFFEKITQEPGLANKNIAIVAGGFHTDGLRQKLREARISYMVITPDLGKEMPDEDLYFKRLKDNVSSQTLSAKQNRETDAQDAAIAKAIVALHNKSIQSLAEAEEIVAASYISAQARAGRSFKDASPEEQEAAVRSAWNIIKTSTTPKTLSIRAADLSALLKDSETAGYVFAQAVKNPANAFAVLYDSFLDIPDAVDVSNKNVRIVKGNDFDRALKQVRTLREALKNQRLAIMAMDYENDRALVLDVSVVSLFIYPILIEQGWDYSFQDAETQSIIQTYLEIVLEEEGFKISA